MRRFVARLLRRLADRLAPAEWDMRFIPLGGGGASYVASNVTPSEPGATVTYTPPPHGYQGP